MGKRTNNFIESLITILPALIAIAFFISLFVGYVSCIVKFVRCDFESPYKAEVIYGTGVFTGLGVVIGWLDIEDGIGNDTIKSVSNTKQLTDTEKKYPGWND